MRSRVPLAPLFLIGVLLLPRIAGAATFVGGPSVRVSANTQVEFTWITDVMWFERLEIFDSANATVPIFTQWVVDGAGTRVPSTHPLIEVPLLGPITANTTFWFRVTAEDPGDPLATIASPTAAPWTPFYTGAQTLSNVSAASITTSSATIEWQANVIGFGKVVFGTSPSSLGQSAQDTYNITDHAIPLAGLSPSTTYYFRASNTHAIDGDELASQTSQFATASIPTTVVLTEPNASPRVIEVGQASTVSIRVKNQGNPVAGVAVGFAVDTSSVGGGTLSVAQINTDSNGVATVQFTANRRGLVNINVFPPVPGAKSQNIPIVVR